MSMARVVSAVSAANAVVWHWMCASMGSGGWSEFVCEKRSPAADIVGSFLERSFSVPESRVYSVAFFYWCVWAVITLIGVIVVVAPYGRFHKGSGISYRWGFAVYESPGVVLSALVFFTAPMEVLRSAACWLIFGLFEIHYIYRAFVYPFRLKSSSNNLVLWIAVIVFLFNVCNSYFITRYCFHFASPFYSQPGAITSPAFIAGLCVALFGVAINHHADNILLNLRKPGETGYKIPRGGMFEYVSGANYFGEMVEWWGFALMTSMSPPAVVFACGTMANLFPRAIQYHKWYLDKFKSEYPQNRKAVIPFIW